MVKILLSILGFLIILLLCTEEARTSLKNLWRRHTRTRREKFFAYPLAFTLALLAAGLIVFSLWVFLSTTFSYD